VINLITKHRYIGHYKASGEEHSIALIPNSLFFTIYHNVRRAKRQMLISREHKTEDRR